MSAPASAVFPRTACYAANGSGGSPMLNGDFSVNTDLVTKLARYQTITVGIPPWYSPAGEAECDWRVIDLLRATNPNIKILAYQLLSDWFLDPDFVPNPADDSFFAEWHRAITSNNGWTPTFLAAFNACAGEPNCEAASHIPHEGYEVDLSNQGFMTAATNLCLGVLSSGRFDGMFFDFLSPSISPSIPGSSPANDALRLIECNKMVAALKGTGLLVCGNGPGMDIVTGLDGAFREGYPDTGTPEALPHPLPFSAIQTWQASRNNPHDWLQGGDGFPNNHTTVAACARARYTAATGCITGCHHSHGPGRDNSGSCATICYEKWWYDEYSVTPVTSSGSGGESDFTGANTGWLGTAKGSAVLKTNGLWRRDFENGIVLLNPTAATIIEDLGPTNRWRRIKGSQDPAFNNGVTNRFESIPTVSALFLVEMKGKPRRGRAGAGIRSTS